VLAATLLWFACQYRPQPTPPALVERAAVTMGSELRLTAWTPDEAAALAAFAEVFREFARLDVLLSVWRAGSDVERINQAAGQAAVRTSEEVRVVLREARQASEWTGGKFDVTFGVLSSLWKFDHDQDNRRPRDEDVRARLPLIDYTAVEIDDGAGTVYLRRPGMRVHLGGIGKGFAIDRAAAILRARGLHDFLIRSGGDLYVGGHHGNRPWRVGIRDPRGAEDQVFASLDLSDGTVSTSGDYERFFVEGGRRYHHILDPDVGQPARGCRSVTIVTNRAVVADALSTGVFVLGPTAGMALIERLSDVEGVIVSDRNEVLISTGLKDRLVLRAPFQVPSS
jgi:FAD:protein FMN transferase